MSLKYRRLDENGDYSFGRGTSDFITDTDAIAQSIITKLKLYVGEWYENINEGIPMWQSILGAYGSKTAIIDKIIEDRIMEVDGVSKISKITSAIINRQYSFSATVDTIYGTITVTNGVNQ